MGNNFGKIIFSNHTFLQSTGARYPPPPHIYYIVVFDCNLFSLLVHMVYIMYAKVNVNDYDMNDNPYVFLYFY